MAITPTGWISSGLLAVEDIIAGSTNHRTLMGVATDPADRALIYWQDFRGAKSTPFTCISIVSGRNEESEALRVVHHADVVEVYLVWPVSKVGATTDKDITTIATNALGGVLSDIDALINTGSYLFRARREWLAPSRTADNGPHPGCWESLLTFSWEV